MSKSKRIELREAYMQGWYQMDIDRLLASTAANFIFDDPAEPAPVTRAHLAQYMLRWDARVRSLQGANEDGAYEWHLTHKSRVDANGLLTDWEWWQIIGIELQGAAVVTTGNNGVLLERITYFDRGIHPFGAQHG